MSVKPVTILIFIAAMFVVIVAGVMVSDAMGRGLGQLLVTLFGIAVMIGIGAGLASFVVWAYGRATETRMKASNAANEFELQMAKQGLVRRGGPYIPIRYQIEAPQTQQRAPVPTDPRRHLLIELCLMTMRADGYGASSKRLMTADAAQAYSKANGGYFADRTKWEDASKYGQDCHFLFTQRGGAPEEQGLKVDGDQVGGYTVADLLSALTRHDQLQAITALPAASK